MYNYVMITERLLKLLKLEMTDLYIRNIINFKEMVISHFRAIISKKKDDTITKIKLKNEDLTLS